MGGLKQMNVGRCKKMELGDKVRNKRDGRLGIVITLHKSGSISVLENVAPVVINTHDSEKTLEIVEENSVPIYDDRDIF